MSLRLTILALISCVLLMPMSAHAELKGPSPLSDKIAPSGRSKLAQMRSALLDKFDALQRDIDTQTQQCSSVPDDNDALIASCHQSRSILGQQIASYNNALASYEQSLSVALRAPSDRGQPGAIADAAGHLQKSDVATIQREVAGIQTALRQLNKAMALDASQREEWEKESETATRDAWILAGSAVLDLYGRHVAANIRAADSEVKNNIDLLSGTIEKDRREQLHAAFAVLEDRKKELQRLGASVKELQNSYGGATLANTIVEGRASNMEIALDSIWKAGGELNLIPPQATWTKHAVDASYLTAVQAASTWRLGALNANSEQYLAAVKVLKARMETLVKAEKSQAGTGISAQ